MVSHNERWVLIPDFPAYEISDLGRVRTAYRNLKILKLNIRKNGYATVGLYNQFYKKAKTFLVHRLVLLAFVGPPPYKYQAHHLDNIRLNNRLSNLQWVTAKTNISHKVLHGTALFGERTNSARLTSAQVLAIRAQYSAAAGKRNWGAVKLARELGVHKDTIWRVANRTWWKHV